LGLLHDEIHRFGEGLKFINDNPFGAAVLQSMEDWITLAIKYNPNGALDVSGEVTDKPGVGNRLSFELHGFDQTHLSSWLSQLSVCVIQDLSAPRYLAREILSRPVDQRVSGDLRSSV
jgi:hypothetical protein